MTDNTPQNESAATPDAPKPRNPVEQAIVRGLIGLMLLLVGIEASAKFGYDRSFATLTAAVERSETSDEILDIKDVPSMLSGFYQATDVDVPDQPMDRLATYRWPSLFKDYGLTLRYRKGFGVVIALNSENSPQEATAPVAGTEMSAGDNGESRDTASAESQESSGPMAGSGRGRSASGGEEGGQRRGFDPMQRDTDKDGRLSREEVSERMLAIFETIDANADGFLDAEELAKWRESNPRRGRSGGGPNAGEERPTPQ